ncbi:MAG: hypothetical protein ACXQT1_05960 [Methermicoccaceae archaeon]
MSDFERKLVNVLNAAFRGANKRAIAHRMKQSRFTSQVVDVLVDSLDPECYLAIECKSISLEKGAKALYFSQHFTVDSHGVHQLTHMREYLGLSGRRGILAVELRRGAGKRKEAYFIPWCTVIRKFDSKEVGFSVGEIERYPAIGSGVLSALSQVSEVASEECGQDGY